VRRNYSEAEDDERLAMCAVVLARREKDGSTEAPSAASEFLPSHGAVKEEATDQLDPVCQGAEESPPVLQLEVPAEASGENRVIGLNGAQVRRHVAVLERMGWTMAPADMAQMVRELGWHLGSSNSPQRAESEPQGSGHGQVASEISRALIRLAESMEPVGAKQQDQAATMTEEAASTATELPELESWLAQRRLRSD
jgi:hypothetical protein